MRGIEDTSVLGVGLQSGVGQLGVGYLGVRGESLDTDQLSLDLQFAADKTLTARKGPTPVFTRASSGRFVGSDGLIQSAGNNIARFDHDPITLACKGLLIEEGRTNLVIRSEDFSTSWIRSGLSTVSANEEVAPDGATTADKLVENTSSGFHGITQIPPTVAGTTYFGSIFIKASGRNFAMIYTGASNGNGRYISIPADGTGTVLGNYNANNSTVTLQYIGNGWYRATILIFAAGGTGNSIEAYASTNGTTTSYTGDGTSGILVWGAQLEAGSFPTSYIPTTTASVIRSADVCSITGSAFTGFWNRFAGTCVIGVGSSSGTGPRFVSNLVAARTLEIYGTTNIEFFEAAGGQEIRVVTSATYPLKLGLTYAINDYQSAYNGLLGGSDTNTGGTIPNATELHIGSLGGASNRLTGHIQFIRYFKKRLANQKLQTLTA